MGRIGREYVNAVERFKAEHEISQVRSRKDDVKEQIAREYFTAADHDTRDFGIGRRLTPGDLGGVVSIAHQFNQRFLDHQLEACHWAADTM